MGGIKEKILAARRAGITTLVLPKLNEKDVTEVPKYALQDLTIHYVSHVEEVFDLVLTEAPAVSKPKATARKGLRLVQARSVQKNRKVRHQIKGKGSSAAKPYN